MKKVVVLLIAVTMLALPVASTATSLMKLDSFGLFRFSERIIEGTVTSVRTEWGPEHTEIYTRADIDVIRNYKGQGPDQLTISYLGGQLGSMISVMSGTPKFVAGEKVLLFLDHRGNGTWGTVGMVQGKFTLLYDEELGMELAVRDPFAGPLELTAIGGEFDPSTGDLPAQDLLQEIDAQLRTAEGLQTR